MSTVQENVTKDHGVEQTPAWKLEGLPGQPIAETSPGKMHYVQLDTLIRDETGKIVTAPRHDNVEKLMSEHLGKTIEAIKLYPGKGWSRPNEFEDVVTFRYKGHGRLSLLERRAVAAFAWMANHYYAPMKRRDNTVFPTVLNELPKELQSPRIHVQTWKAFTEDKAIQVAGVLESMWPEISTTVFEDGDGWFVAIDSGEAEFDNQETLERAETVLWMLSDFDVVPSERGMMTQDFDDDESEHIHAKAVRAFNAYTAQQRIEDGINAILSSLSDIATPGKAKVPAPAVNAFAEPPAEKDAHTISPKPGKKFSPKKLA